MKINFNHPVTKKPSSVILPDIWLRSWYLANDSQPSDVLVLVRCLAQDWFLRHSASCERVGFVPATFTQYCEATISNSVYDQLCLHTPIAFNRDSKPGKAFSRSESKIRG
jgi:hypothetical protein